MNSYIPVLESAISDVGYWTWWGENLPDIFQVEFDGVQLWSPPRKPGSPPSGKIALCFEHPAVIAFLKEKDAGDLPTDWDLALHEDRIDPFPVHHDFFTLSSEELLLEMLEASEAKFMLGTKDDLLSNHAPVKLAFRSGNTGLIVRAEMMHVLSFAGELTPEAVLEASEKWWIYWREYWERRETDQALPKDYACEVTIPAK